MFCVSIMHCFLNCIHNASIWILNCISRSTVYDITDWVYSTGEEVTVDCSQLLQQKDWQYIWNTPTNVPTDIHEQSICGINDINPLLLSGYCSQHSFLLFISNLYVSVSLRKIMADILLGKYNQTETCQPSEQVEPQLSEIGYPLISAISWHIPKISTNIKETSDLNIN